MSLVLSKSDTHWGWFEIDQVCGKLLVLEFVSLWKRDILFITGVLNCWGEFASFCLNAIQYFGYF